MNATIFHGTQHLQEHELLPFESPCPFCSSGNRNVVALLQQAPDVQLLLCTTCHAASASRIPTQSALDSYYSSYYDDRVDKVTVDTPQRLASHIFSMLKTKWSSPLSSPIIFRILDFGGGDGSISLAIAYKLLASRICSNVTITLVEYNAIVKAPEDNRITMTAVDSLNNMHTNLFQLVIASAIIEHLPKPAEAITNLLSSLEAGGLMYIRTPAMLPFLRLAKTLGMQFDFSFPGHLHDLGYLFWNNFIRSMNLTGNFIICSSRPSLVETSFSQHFFRTAAAYILKAPGFIFPKLYPFVGGWEIVIRRNK